MRNPIGDWIDTFDEFWFGAVELIDAGGDTVSRLSDSADGPS